VSTSDTKPETSAAVTDVGEFVTDLDGGMFDRMLSIALSQTAAAVVDHERVGEVTVKFKMEKIQGTTQIRLAHTLKFSKPTMNGKAGEETEGATVLHVGRYGALSLAQPSLLAKDRQGNLT
jgi:hypothetical protein